MLLEMMFALVIPVCLPLILVLDLSSSFCQRDIAEGIVNNAE